MESRQQLLQLVGADITGSPPSIKIFKQLQVLVGTAKYTAETLGPAATTQQVREAADIIARWSAQHSMTNPKRSGDMGKYHAHGHLRAPVFPVAKGSVPSEGRATPPLPHPGDHHPRHRKNRGPSAGTSQLGKKTQCRSLFLRTKGLCALLLELPPRPPPNLQEGHSPQSGCATVGLRRGDCDRAGSSQPPATSGNGERCRFCRRRRRRGGGGEGEGTHATHGPASPPGRRHDEEVGAAVLRAGSGEGSRRGLQLTPPPRRVHGALQRFGGGRNLKSNWMSTTRTPRRSGASGPKMVADQTSGISRPPTAGIGTSRLCLGDRQVVPLWFFRRCLPGGWRWLEEMKRRTPTKAIKKNSTLLDN
ncbi:uncharacterized protein LOC124906649 [Homo sapiens]|uniref:uncharacterized protein LOC124906649 n=1 Tax=Homo sapiens TaxID=9606 RepID=UPI001FB08E36|nr:uncharacterized protein LOC124906649 [Homo sapiens]